ncbi:MAG: hypothetical protein AAGD06_22830 [Acidobacteriota bacterium]
MPAITNDSRSLVVVEDDRATFDVDTGGRSGTPLVEIQVVNGNLVEVSCEFIAKNPQGGFSYEIKATSADAQKVSRRPANLSESSAGWQSCTRTDYFLIQTSEGVGADDATFEVFFGDGGLSNPGQAGSFQLSARLVGSINL